MKQLNSNPSVGLKAIIDVCGLSEKEITVSDIVFKIGPRIIDNPQGLFISGYFAEEDKGFSIPYNLSLIHICIKAGGRGRRTGSRICGPELENHSDRSRVRSAGSCLLYTSEISDALGKETIDSFNTSENRGSQTSHGLNYQKLGKALMSEDEIAIMDGGKCILQLRGVRPFFSEKFDITKHPHYKYLADADKKNTFDVDRFLSTLRRKRQQVVAQDESFDLYEIDLSDEDTAAE